VLYPHVARLDIDIPGQSTACVDETSAVSWVDAELSNLVAAADHSATHAPNAAASLLSRS
jgi:hypothetical protein